MAFKQTIRDGMFFNLVGIMVSASGGEGLNEWRGEKLWKIVSRVMTNIRILVSSACAYISESRRVKTYCAVEYQLAKSSDKTSAATETMYWKRRGVYSIPPRHQREDMLGCAYNEINNAKTHRLLPLHHGNKNIQKYVGAQ